MGGLVEVATVLVEGVSAVEGVQKRSGGECPDPVGFPVGEGVQEVCVGGRHPGPATRRLSSWAWWQTGAIEPERVGQHG